MNDVCLSYVSYFPERQLFQLILVYKKEVVSGCWYCLLEVWVWGLYNNCGVTIAWVSEIVWTSFSEFNKFSNSISISASVSSLIMGSFNLYASSLTYNSFFLISLQSNIIKFPKSHGLRFLHVASILFCDWLLLTNTFDMVKWFNYTLLLRQGILQNLKFDQNY